MPTDTWNVGLSGETGSDRPRLDGVLLAAFENKESWQGFGWYSPGPDFPGPNYNFLRSGLPQTRAHLCLFGGLSYWSAQIGVCPHFFRSSFHIGDFGVSFVAESVRA